MGLAARHKLPVAVGVVLLALGGGLAATRLQTTTSNDTFVSRSSPVFKATERFHRDFGDDAVYVLVSEPLTKLVLTSDILRLVGLEGCLSGNAPANVVPPGGRSGPCGQLAKTKPSKVVFGPGTFVNTSVTQIQQQLAKRLQESSAQAARAAAAARKLAAAHGYSKAAQDRVANEASTLVSNQAQKDLITLGIQYKLTSIPQLNDPGFVSTLVFDDTKAPGTPKARFAYIFPTRNSALIQIRLKPDLSESQRKHAIALIRAAAAMPRWALPNGKGHYVVTGAPVVVSDLTTSITNSIETLLLAVLLVMALTLAVVFRTRLRLLPLGVALAAAGLTFGALSLLGASLTMASIAVLPVIVGLTVDYAIQLQARIQERGGDITAAIDHVAHNGASTVATAAAATAAGFLVLMVSPIPMVRGFGLLLVGGIVVAIACALTLGTAVQALATPSGEPRAPGRFGLMLGDALRGAGVIVFENRAAKRGVAMLSSAGRRALKLSTGHPQRVLAVAAVIAVAGWALDTQTRVESDVQKLVPQNLPALKNLNALERSTGVGGEIDVVVRSASLTDPKVIGWMAGYQKRLTDEFGYSSKRGCGKAELCPAFSLPDLFRNGLKGQTKQSIDQLLNIVPKYFSQGVLAPDHQTATLAFGIKLMPLKRQEQVIETMRHQLKAPPGVTAELAGLPVLAAKANADVSSPWRRVLMLVLGLLAVAAVLLVALRDRRRALVPLVPIVLATGWSAFVLFAMRIPLNPMSVTLGALVIAISTEFSVLLAERYRSERTAGRDTAAALEHAYRSTGAAVVASGTTAIAGFAVLVASDIRMLRDFGAVTVVDLTVSLLGVLVVLPAVLVVAEERAARAPASGPARSLLSRLRGAPAG